MAVRVYNGPLVAPGECRGGQLPPSFYASKKKKIAVLTDALGRPLPE